MSRKIGALGLIVIIVAGCSQGCVVDVDRTDDEAKIRALATQYQTAYNEQNSRSYGALWAPEADAIILDNEHTVGRDAILRGQEAFWASSPGTRMNLTVNTVRFVGPDVAIADFNRHGEVQNRGTWILHRRGGNWIIVALRVLQAQMETKTAAR